MESTHAYIEFQKCGCVASMIADLPQMRAQIAKAASRAVRDGGHIRRFRNDELREEWGGWTFAHECPHTGPRTGDLFKAKEGADGE